MLCFPLSLHFLVPLLHYASSEHHYSSCSPSLPSTHPSSSAVSVSFLRSARLCRPVLSAGVRIQARSPSLKSNPGLRVLRSHYRRSVKREKWISPLLLCVVEAVQETILSPHPSPLAGRAPRLPPSPAALYHVSPPAIFPGGERNRGGNTSRGQDPGWRNRRNRI